MIPAAAATTLPISAVVACTPSWGIGMGGTLPWLAAGTRLPQDVAYFKDMTSRTNDPTKHNAVIMGRRTYESIPPAHRPLPGRLNVVITRDSGWLTRFPSSSSNISENKSLSSPADTVTESESGIPVSEIVTRGGVETTTSLAAALAMLTTNEYHVRTVEKAVVVGGVQLFEEAIEHPWCNEYHLTVLDTEFPCDAFLTAKTVSKIAMMEPTEVSDEIEENGVKYRNRIYNPSRFPNPT